MVKETYVTLSLPKGMKQTEIGLIPEDWEVVKIKEISSIKTGSKNTQDRIENGRYPFFVRSQTIERINSYSYDEEAVLTAGDGVGVGKVFHYVNEKFDLHQRVYLMHQFRKDVSGFYFFKYFQNNFLGRIMQMTAKSSVDSVRMETISEMPIPLPPLAEQEAIAAALSDCDAWIESLEAVIAKKRLIKQGAMQELLTPKEDWEVRKLGDVAQFRRGSFPQPYGLDKWYDDINGMPFIQVFDVAKNRRLKLDTKRKISEAAQFMSVFVPKNTIVLTIQGSIGRIALTQYDAYCDRTLLIFERINSGIDQFFFLLSVEQIFEIEKEKAPGGTIKTITKEALSDFKFVYPKSLSEQTRIATVLSDMDAELEALGQKLNKARQIKQGMMQELLTGRVRLV